MQARAGFPIVVTAPSGTGKTSICRAVASEMKNVAYSVSVTTRSPRKGEKSGRDYIFKTRSEFKRLTAGGKLAEWAGVYDNWYGTPRKRLEDNLKKGRSVLLALDYKGAVSIRKKYPGAVLIYLLPPSRKELERRLRGRSTDTGPTINLRLQSARRELLYAAEYDYLVVNRKLNETIEVLKAIITGESYKRERFGKIKYR